MYSGIKRDTTREMQSSVYNLFLKVLPKKKKDKGENIHNKNIAQSSLHLSPELIHKLDSLTEVIKAP